MYLIGMTSLSRPAVLEGLGQIASLQEGFFSTAQAQQVGIPSKRLARLVASGILDRDERGIYRFASYPDTENAELWRAVLWPSVDRSIKMNALGKGVLSYGTALDLWNVSTINPATIDITLPKSYRLRRTVPSIYRIHRVDLAENEITFIRGLPVTTLYRTLFDLIIDARDQQFVDEALKNTSMLAESDRAQLKALRIVDPSTLREAHVAISSRTS
jgi:predicted transcriptional regulator of viral defense system